MEHQDWNNIVFKAKTTSHNNNNALSKNSTNKEKYRLEAPKQLGQIIAQARTQKSKTQKILASELGISPQILNRWEVNKEIPSNAQIASIEKNLQIKLPRCKKIAIKDME